MKNQDQENQGQWNEADPNDGSAAYYALPKDKHWLGDHNSPGLINGRPTDISEIGGSLEQLITTLYQDGITDMIPGEIYDDLHLLIAHLRISERLIGELITAVSENVAKRHRIGKYKLDG